MIKNIKRVILLGPQGSGKSTQAVVIAKFLKIKEVSSGHILRQALRSRGALGRELKTYITPGRLVPDPFVIKIVVEKLYSRSFKKGFLLDGFPRNLHQAKVLDKSFTIDGVFNLDISDAEAMRRLSGRLVCRRGHIWHIRHHPPRKKSICDFCGLPLYVRADDQGQAIAKRLSIYRKHTAQLLGYYKKQKKLVVFDGEQPIKKISRDIIKYLRQNAG